MLASKKSQPSKPKMNVVFSDARKEAVIRAAVGDAAEMDGTTLSGAIESTLLDAFLPENPKARRLAESVYLGEYSVRDMVAGEFSADAAVVNWGDRAEGRAERELCDFAARAAQASRAMVDADAPDGMGGKIVYHAHSCWDSVVLNLEDHLKTGDAPDGRALELDIAEAKGLLGTLAEGAAPVEAPRFYLLALRQWDCLKTSTYTYRALMDITRMSSAWAEDAALRAAFSQMLDSVYKAREE